MLVATDVVGRGIDVTSISHIINYDIPQFCDDYVHRVGRTGRMGREGVAYTFVTPEEGNELTRIEMRINRLLKRDEMPGFASSPSRMRTEPIRRRGDPHGKAGEGPASRSPRSRSPAPLYGRGGRPHPPNSPGVVASRSPIVRIEPCCPSRPGATSTDEPQAITPRLCRLCARIARWLAGRALAGCRRRRARAAAARQGRDSPARRRSI